LSPVTLGCALNCQTAELKLSKRVMGSRALGIFQP